MRHFCTALSSEFQQICQHSWALLIFIKEIYRNLEDLGQNEIMSSTIGKFVMDGLKGLDHVGYVRFASVYTDFKEAKDFEQFVDNINVKVKK